MNKKMTTSWEDVKKELLKDPVTYKEYKSLEPEYRIISQMIKIRTEQGLTQKELADKIGTRQSNISRLESGEYNPSLEFLKKVAKGLNKELVVSLNG
ncbi:MAG: helix-turn-helix domain-containing protein [bacterium]